MYCVVDMLPRNLLKLCSVVSTDMSSKIIQFRLCTKVDKMIRVANIYQLSELSHASFTSTVKT